MIYFPLNYLLTSEKKQAKIGGGELVSWGIKRVIKGKVTLHMDG
jgi:hypothetical protein